MKKLIIIALIIVIIIVVFLILRFQFSQKQEIGDITPTPSVILPTISDNITVALSARSDRKAVVLTIKGLTPDIQSIDYEMTYTTEGGLVRGINGIIKLKGEKEITRDDLTLGSCSTGGKCTYDEGVTEIDLSLRFNTPSSSSIFRKTYSL